jgi:hypothetical protein
MKNVLPILFLLLAQVSFGQVFLEDFDATPATALGGASSFTRTVAGGELRLTGTNAGAYDAVSYRLSDAAGAPVTVDAKGNNKLYVRAKASSVGTQLRVDVQDAAGYLTSLAGLTKTMTADYIDLEFDFTGNYNDGGYGGTPCMTGPCPVDGSKIVQLIFYVNPGQGGYNGDVVIDYVSFGEKKNLIASTVFQDHFTSDSSLTSLGMVIPAGIAPSRSGTEFKLTGNGTSEQYGALAYVFRNPTTWTNADIDATKADNKLYVKMKSTVPNTTFRIDLQDLNDYITTQGSVTKILTTDYAVYEYDFSGVYSDLGYGGTPCTQQTAPCPVDATRIKNMLMYINPGTGMFLGEVTIDYISFGVSLEPAGPAALLVYGDHMNNSTLDYTTPTAGYTVTEAGSDLVIAGDGSAGAYSNVSYILSDKTTNETVFVDMAPANNKVYIRAKTESGTVPLRLDLLDTTGYTTSLAALTKVVNDQWTEYTFDFTANFNDGGYGGTPCMTGPCPVNPKAIRQMLLYPAPATGGFAGKLFIDYISIGKPLGADLGPAGVINYSDDMPNIASASLVDPSGVTSTVANGVWTLAGNGTAGAYSATRYDMHDAGGTSILANAKGSGDKLYVRAKASAAGTELRIDPLDNANFLSNLNAKSATLTTDYAVYELNYAGAYQDGAYGGTPCTVSGCPVDAERIKSLLVYINPATGMFNGTVDIDWLAFGAPISGVTNPNALGKLTAYPTPMESQLTVEFDQIASADMTIEILNMAGVTVQRRQLGRRDAGMQQMQLDVTNLTQGVYVMRVVADGQQVGYLKLVK